MNASEAKELVAEAIKGQGQSLPEKLASISLQLIYPEIRAQAVSGSSSYLFTLEASTDKQLQLHTKVLGCIVGELQKRKFTVIPKHTSTHLAIKIEW